MRAIETKWGSWDEVRWGGPGARVEGKGWRRKLKEIYSLSLYLHGVHLLYLHLFFFFSVYFHLVYYFTVPWYHPFFHCMLISSLQALYLHRVSSFIVFSVITITICAWFGVQSLLLPPSLVPGFNFPKLSYLLFISLVYSLATCCSSNSLHHLLSIIHFYNFAVYYSSPSTIPNSCLLFASFSIPPMSDAHFFSLYLSCLLFISLLYTYVICRLSPFTIPPMSSLAPTMIYAYVVCLFFLPYIFAVFPSPFSSLSLSSTVLSLLPNSVINCSFPLFMFPYVRCFSSFSISTVCCSCCCTHIIDLWSAIPFSLLPPSS